MLQHDLFSDALETCELLLGHMLRLAAAEDVLHALLVSCPPERWSLLCNQILRLRPMRPTTSTRLSRTKVSLTITMRPKERNAGVVKNGLVLSGLMGLFCGRGIIKPLVFVDGIISYLN